MKKNIEKIISDAKKISKKTVLLTENIKNEILRKLVKAIEENKKEILIENKKDILYARKKKLDSMIDRLILDNDRINNIILQIKEVISLNDNVGKIISRKKMKSGIEVFKKKVPLGVIAMIYESRPNVTIDASVLSFKSGNAIILKGGKEAKNSNNILVEIFQNVLDEYGLKNAIQILKDNSYDDIQKILTAKRSVDLIIPRGSKRLIDFVSKNSLVPIIETGASVVHTFVDENADFEMAKKILINEKTRRISVCNVLDTILIHKNLKNDFLENIIEELTNKKVRIHTADLDISKKFNLKLEDESIYHNEWLDYDVSIKVVSNIDEALEHIEKYSLGHSESIITENKENAENFLNTVDSACVYWNTSTAFSDGAEFGLGAEIGISTQKLHARGPFALEVLNTTKWIIKSDGKIRN